MSTDDAARRERAEKWADGLGPILAGLSIDAHLAGQECGEERAADEIAALKEEIEQLKFDLEEERDHL